MASRYCEVDLLSPTSRGAVRRHRRAAGRGCRRSATGCTSTSRSATSSPGRRGPRSTSSRERIGVCRDFHAPGGHVLPLPEHPGALRDRLPGRHRRAAGPYPMDFSAWFEVYLGDRWYTFDARHNIPRIGRVLMARGLRCRPTCRSRPRSAAPSCRISKCDRRSRIERRLCRFPGRPDIPVDTRQSAGMHARPKVSVDASNADEVYGRGYRRNCAGFGWSDNIVVWPWVSASIVGSGGADAAMSAQFRANATTRGDVG